MRFALWSLVLAAVAVGIALFAERSTGYVVIVSAPWRIELSVNLFVFLVVAGYFGFYLLVRLVATLAAIPARVRAYRAERERSGQRRALNESLLAFFQGRYASAEKSAAQAKPPPLASTWAASRAPPLATRSPVRRALASA